MLSPRFLSPEAKAAELAGWEARKSERPPNGDLAGKGWPDPEIVPLVDDLNLLSGVCTLQSCAGHHGGNGTLWLWFDERTSAEFDRWAHVLACLPGVEKVSREYTPWGQQIAAIEFDGRPGKTYQSVLAFFSALTVRTGNSLPDPSPDIRCPTHQRRASYV